MKNVTEVQSEDEKKSELEKKESKQVGCDWEVGKKVGMGDMGRNMNPLKVGRQKRTKQHTDQEKQCCCFFWKRRVDIFCNLYAWQSSFGFFVVCCECLSTLSALLTKKKKCLS